MMDNIIVSRRWDVAIEHADMAIVLLDNLRNYLNPVVQDIIPDSYIHHAVKRIRLNRGGMWGRDKVPYAILGYTRVPYFQIDTAFAYAPDLRSLDGVFIGLSDNSPMEGYPTESGGHVAIFVPDNRSYIQAVKEASRWLCGSHLWIVH